MLGAAHTRLDCSQDESGDVHVPTPVTAEPGGAAKVSLPSFYNAATPAAQNELWQRMTNDPLASDFPGCGMDLIQLLHI